MAAVKKKVKVDGRFSVVFRSFSRAIHDRFTHHRGRARRVIRDARRSTSNLSKFRTRIPRFDSPAKRVAADAGSTV